MTSPLDMDGKGRPVTELRRAEIFRGLEITEADTVIDIGCGSGEKCVFAGDLGADVIGIEVNPDLIPILEAKMRETSARSFRAILSTSETIPLPDASGDVVICTEVVEHISDPAAFLAELARIGRPGARYWISVPDPRSESMMKVVSPADYFQFPNHINIFERDQFASLIRGAGLAIDHRDSECFFWSMWWVFRMACGTDHLPGGNSTPPPLLAKWEDLWGELHKFPMGHRLARAFNEVMPKSQVVIAHKPVESQPARGSFKSGWRGALAGPHRGAVKRLLDRF
jgi:SAM-dependent methyltransferase